MLAELTNKEKKIARLKLLVQGDLTKESRSGKSLDCFNKLFIFDKD